MEVIVHQVEPSLLERPLASRGDALRRILQPMYQHVPMPGDPVELHHHGGGFRVDLDDPRYAPASNRLHGCTESITHELHRAADRLGGLDLPARLDVMLMLGNPDDAYLTDTVGGYYGMGGVPGWIYLLAWPTDEVVDRIAHCAVHEFHHQVRYRHVEWNPMTVTVGEHVVSEGLAEAFVRELSGPSAMGPWSGMVTGDELESAYARIAADINLAGMQHTPSYVLGDTAAVRFGGQPLGIPDMAGYAVGLCIVDAHLAASGLSAAESTVLPSAEILANAGLP